MSAPPTTVSSYVKRLIARGHVVQVPHPEDGRSYRLALTAAGRNARTTAGRRFLRALAAVEAALTVPAADEQQAMGALRSAIDAAVVQT